MANDTTKKKVEYRVVSDDEARSIALSELGNSRIGKGFGKEIPFFENEADLPEHLKAIIEQYYTAVLVMVPNVCIAGFPYEDKTSGVQFKKTCENLFGRIDRASGEIRRIIDLYKRLKVATNENAKSTLLTYIKLFETDLINNIAHMYDVENETGTKGARVGVQFAGKGGNFSTSGHLTTKYESEYDQETRKRAINKYIRNSLIQLTRLVGEEPGKSVDLSDFDNVFVLGARARLLRRKDHAILDLVQGDYDVSPAVIVERVGRVIRDQIMFFGKRGVTATACWHLGSSGELSHTDKLNGVPTFNRINVDHLVNRSMPNYETICQSLAISFGATGTLRGEATSQMDKMLQYREFARRKKQNMASERPNAAKAEQYQNSMAQLRNGIILEKYFGPEAEKLMELVGLAMIAQKHSQNAPSEGISEKKTGAEPPGNME